MTGEYPLILVEDDHHMIDYLPAGLTKITGIPVTTVQTIEGLTHEIERLNAIPGSPEPVVLLDAGLPGICRFDTVNTVVDLCPRARVIQWTANPSPPTHTGALIDGAYASLEKHPTTLPVLAEVIAWVATGRHWCEPTQAQWFIEMLDTLAHHRQTGKDYVWKSTQLGRLPDDLSPFTDQLADLKNGGAMSADDTWFVAMIKAVSPLWLTDALRTARTALTIYPTKDEAARAIGKQPRALGGDSTRISGRLMPHRFGADASPGARDSAVIRILVKEHQGCVLSDEEHIGILQYRTAAESDD